MFENLRKHSAAAPFYLCTAIDTMIGIGVGLSRRNSKGFKYVM